MITEFTYLDFLTSLLPSSVLLPLHPTSKYWPLNVGTSRDVPPNCFIRNVLGRRPLVYKDCASLSEKYKVLLCVTR